MSVGAAVWFSLAECLVVSVRKCVENGRRFQQSTGVLADVTRRGTCNVGKTGNPWFSPWKTVFWGRCTTFSRTFHGPGVPGEGVVLRWCGACLRGIVPGVGVRAFFLDSLALRRGESTAESGCFALAPAVQFSVTGGVISAELCCAGGRGTALSPLPHLWRGGGSNE
eukprot:8810700-Prorocentrum_lima.AAC.1